ncbi:MAG: nodulation protein NfeD [Longimicrobiales bacterium]|nr:nodulation protein NfeD [Longimicrobiales bacterium]
MSRPTPLYPLVFLAFAALFWAVEGQERASSGSTIHLIRVEEPITPTSTDYIRRALEEARDGGAEALLIELDTPGGLLESTRQIVQTFYEAEVPVIVYVTPAGARAASAGTFITMAAHVAAMAPSTTIGAASPVSIGSGGQAQMDTVMQNKAFEYAESFAQTIAERRDRNVEWAISAVREAEAVTASEALDLNVIDLVSATRDDLLREIDGMEVVVGPGEGEAEVLRTADATVVEVEKTLAERFLGMIIRPELMLFLTMVAIYGIIGEVTNPGAIIPGVTGVIALILLLYASAAMPVNIAGYLLVGLAVILFVTEAFTPTFGLLIAAGSVSFFLGGLILFQDLPEGMELSWGWLVPATILTAAFFAWIVTAGIKAQFSTSRTGSEAMIGVTAEVTDPVGPDGGRVFFSGEYWRAVSDEEIPEGETVEIEGIEGLTVRVRTIEGSGSKGASNAGDSRSRDSDARVGFSSPSSSSSTSSSSSSPPTST